MPEQRTEDGFFCPNLLATSFTILLAVWMLAGCAVSHAPAPVPTATPGATSQPEAVLDAAAISPAAPASLPPEPRAPLPAGGGVSVVCENNALRLPLTFPGLEGSQPFGAVSRLLADESYLYIVADGGLYRVDRDALDEGVVNLRPLLAPGARVGERVVQELSDIAADPARGLIYALDKAGHIYRYELDGGRSALVYRISPDAPYDIFPQLIAITVDGLHRPVALDTAYGALWTPTGLADLEQLTQDDGLTDGVDVAAVGDVFYVLHRDGRISQAAESGGALAWAGPGDREAAFSLFASDHLGAPLIITVDGPRREVTSLLPEEGSEQTFTLFAYPDMGLLRDAAYAGGRLYAVADSSLIVYPAPASEVSGEPCTPLLPEAMAQPLLYEEDLISLLSAYVFPIEGGSLPFWPRLYPGAIRGYRLGVHEGIDIFFWNAPEGFGIGSPVLAMSAGRVVRALVDYVDLTTAEYNLLVDRAAAAGETPREVLDRFSGMQVVIDHGSGVRTVYSHLNSIAPGVEEGAIVQAGDVIGTVGVTGTQGEVEPDMAAPHLHFEIWIGDRYLGKGVTIAETMWWLEQAIGPEE